VNALPTSRRWTSADLELLPFDEWWRYEIIDGALYVSEAPGWEHQQTCGRLLAALLDWSRRTGLGQPNIAPGVIFADDDDVIPDVVWTSNARLASVLREGHLHGPPELVVEGCRPARRTSGATATRS
jgi:Uma2 family endonuclease